ncbi:MAG TPA: FliH/SctL family protein [Candidatus Acidoferrum sp.]|jgi:flagellar assembly protein FliH
MSSERTETQTIDAQAEPFLYLSSGADGERNGTAVAWSARGVGPKASPEQDVREAFERGIKEGEAQARSAYDKQLGAVQAVISAALEKFKGQRETYFNRIEPEVVQLALAIGRKILHREAQMDPLLLAGMVHVALEKIDSGTRVRLRAHPEDVHFWNEYFSQAGTSEPAPELIGDPVLQRGECALETEFGSTQISLDTQLKEIEQGFFDLLEQRPKVR